MSTPVVEVPVEVSGSTPDGAVIKLWEQIVPSSLGHIRDHGSEKSRIVHNTPLAGRALKQLIEKKNYWGFLEGEDAALYFRLLSELSDDEFAGLYPDKVKTHSKKGGRPRKYRTARAQKMGHAKRQRLYRERKLLAIPDVTKTPLQLVDN
ncbi:MAG: hypothetical protein WAN12_07550 [Candidatus Acidiferrum sp.]